MLDNVAKSDCTVPGLGDCFGPLIFIYVTANNEDKILHKKMTIYI